MDLRQLRYFLVLADELHFRRAAERLHITQAPLSLAIQGLERELGTELFNRSRRRVALTESGQSLRVDARAILERVQRTRDTIRDLAQGVTGHLRIGVTPACSLLPFFPDLIAAFRSARPLVRIHLREMSSTDQIVGLQGREIDVAIVRNPVQRLAPDVAFTRLLMDPLVVAMRRGHRLSDRPILSIADLREEEFINYPRQLGVGIYEQVNKLCALRGFTPKVVQEVREALTLLGLAAAGLGIAVVPSGLTHIAATNIVFKPLSDSDATTEIHLACRADEPNAVVATFRDLARAATTRSLRAGVANDVSTKETPRSAGRKRAVAEAS
jgi:DNA-binding transcriptional LysR family regulator